MIYSALRASALVLSLLTLSANAADSEWSVGVSTLALEAPHRAGPLSGAVWYPTVSDADTQFYGANPVFVGAASISDAKPTLRPKQGDWPLVLLSHGLGGVHRSLAWLATGLAEQGAIVVAVDHPGSTFADLDPERSLLHGERVRDLQVIIDAFVEDAPLGLRVDPAAIFATGFSYGGWTALSIGGITGDLAGYRQHCLEVDSASSHCGDIARWGIDLESLDAGAWDRSWKDDRVRAVAALDPGLVYGLSGENVANLVPEVQLIALGEGENRLIATDFHRAGLASLLPEASIDVIAPAAHFSALPVCTEMGPEILIEEGDDPVCDEPEGGDRALVHARVVQLISDAFGLTVGSD